MGLYDMNWLLEVYRRVGGLPWVWARRWRSGWEYGVGVRVLLSLTVGYYRYWGLKLRVWRGKANEFP